jgi:uncharacterized protein (DUF1330 family)
MFEYVVGLEVIDDEIYSEYRKNMMPILKTFKGGFGYDFKIDEVLKSEVKAPINRVFTIFFPDKQTADDFFSDSEYLKIKETYFEKSVKSTTIIAEVTKNKDDE